MSRNLKNANAHRTIGGIGTIGKGNLHSRAYMTAFGWFLIYANDPIQNEQLCVTLAAFLDGSMKIEFLQGITGNRVNENNFVVNATRMMKIT